MLFVSQHRFLRNGYGHETLCISYVACDLIQVSVICESLIPFTATEWQPLLWCSYHACNLLLRCLWSVKTSFHSQLLNGSLFSAVLSHSGDDEWEGEYVTINFNTETLLCGAGEEGRSHIFGQNFNNGLHCRLGEPAEVETPSALNLTGNERVMKIW